MKYVSGNEENKQFVEQFLTKYMSLGFGNLPKKEIDILVFTLIKQLGFLEGKNNYSIAKELMLDDKKLKRYLLDSSIRTDTSNTIVSSIQNLQKMIFVEKALNIEIDKIRKTVAFLIEDPKQQRDFIQALRSAGYSYDGNLNPERMEIPIYAFISVFCMYDDDLYNNFKDIASAEIKKQTDREKAFKESLPFTEKIKNGLSVIKVSIDSMAAIATILGYK